MRAAVRGDDRLKMQIEFAGAQRPRQFAADELLVARRAVDRAIVGDDGARALLRRLAQREFSAVGELAARRGVARRLRETGAGADAHHGVDPVRPRHRVERCAQHRHGIGLGGVGKSDGEFVAADAREHRLRAAAPP